MIFRDRREAGEQLAAALATYRDRRPFVLAVPRGGVVVGYEVAAALDAPLDVIIPRKLRAPDNPELAIGAVAHDGSVYLDEALAGSLRVADDYLQREIAEQTGEIQRRMRLYRGDRPLPDLRGMTAIVVDDGLATGATMIAALRAVRAMRSDRLVAAIPVAPLDSAQRLRAEADDVVCRHTPVIFYAVGQFYDNFAQTTDDEVIALLRRREVELKGNPTLEMMATTQLKRTSLSDVHRAAGARMVEFGGWEMPVQYAGIVEEHRAVRTAAGLFDVSHMGEVELWGPGALESIQRLITNDAGRLAVGGGLYSPMCTPDGGIIDDLTVFRLAGDRVLLVVNAARTDRDFQWIAEHARAATARNRSADLALLALQGPKAAPVLQRLTSADLGDLAYFHILEDAPVAGVRCLVSRTGYTGEDGFEIACPWGDGPRVWEALMAAGRADGLVPVGLGARDTLRLEAGYMLYGNDIDETTSPLEAPLGWTVKFDKGEFIGAPALLAQKKRGVERKLVGFETAERAVPRHGYRLLAHGSPVGRVTSGTFGPWVGKPIGLGYVDRAHSHPGASIQVEIRGRPQEARVVKLPFYRRS